MLTKDLLRVSRRGKRYRPAFVDESQRPLAAQLIGTYQGHVGETRGTLDEAVEAIEREQEEFKLVRGFAALLDREAAFEADASVPPERTRRVTFEAAERVGVTGAEDRERAIAEAANDLAVEPAVIEQSLYADRNCNQRLVAFDSRWSPETLLEQYNLSLAQTALFDATEVRIRSLDPKALVSAVKRLGLMYEIWTENGTETPGETRTGKGEWELVVTGPDRLFRSTRRYGTQFARLLRTVAKTAEWQVTATIDDRGTERTMELSDADPVSVPDTEPLVEPGFDSNVEADFATRFRSLALDWELVREPEPLAAGERVMIPDFVFDHRHADFRVFFEIMGFWTPEYVEKKLAQLDAVEDVEMLVAVDESLGVSEEIETRDHRALTYSGSIRLRDVRRALRPYEERVVADAVADLPKELCPDAAVSTLEALADQYGVSETALDDLSFPDHERVGRTLIRPTVLEDLADTLEPGLSLSETEQVLAEQGITETSAVLSRLGYEVAWEGLGGGTLQEKE